MAHAAAHAKLGSRRDLADYVAELCLEAGLTLALAREHSLAQLRLLAEAAGRMQARDALVMSQVVFSAFAAVMHKDNQPILRNLQQRLEEQARG